MFRVAHQRAGMPVWVSRVLDRARKARWGHVLAAVVWLRRTGRGYWHRLPSDERQEVLELARKSRGRRPNLTKGEQKRVAALLKRVPREPAPLAE